MTREEALKIVAEAKEKGERPDLRGTNLRGADLRGADLRGADLRDANLFGADLFGADLRWAKGAGAIEPIGSRGDTLVWNIRQGTLWFYTGCFGGTEAEFLAAVEEEHGDNQHGRAYRAAVAMVRILAEPWLEEEDDDT